MGSAHGASPSGRAPVGMERVVGDDPDMPAVLRFQRGELHAFVPLWRKYHDPLLRFFYTRTGDFHESQDLASLTLTALMRATASFRGSGRAGAGAACQYRTFVLAIARNTLSGWRKRRGRRPERPWSSLPAEWQEVGTATSCLPPMSGAGGGLDRELSAIGDRDAACRALCEVPSDSQFRLLLYRYFLDLPHEAIASLIGVRPAIVNTRLQEARRALARTYRQLGDSHEAGIA